MQTLFSFLLSFRFCLYLLLAMHFFGLLFMQFETTKAFFVLLTPLNLVLSGLFILVHQQQKSHNFWYLVLFFCSAGFFVEVLGVHTGMVFGQYYYGKTLGIQLWGVPLLIGLNWAVLLLATAAVSETILARLPLVLPRFVQKLLKASFAALQMTLLDVLIEPIAMLLDFWQWQANKVPLQNYLAWFVVAFCLHWVYQNTSITKQNNLAKYLLIAQVLFFGGFNVLLLWQ
jgi:uncharacterized membrane protein